MGLTSKDTCLGLPLSWLMPLLGSIRHCPDMPSLPRSYTIMSPMFLSHFLVMQACNGQCLKSPRSCMSTLGGNSLVSLPGGIGYAGMVPNDTWKWSEPARFGHRSSVQSFVQDSPDLWSLAQSTLSHSVPIPSSSPHSVIVTASPKGTLSSPVGPMAGWESSPSEGVMRTSEGWGAVISLVAPPRPEMSDACAWPNGHCSPFRSVSLLSFCSHLHFLPSLLSLYYFPCTRPASMDFPVASCSQFFLTLLIGLTWRQENWYMLVPGLGLSKGSSSCSPVTSSLSSSTDF